MPSYADLILAFRVAKSAIVAERGATGLLDFARFERQLDVKLEKLRTKLDGQAWFDNLEIGQIVVMPKGVSPPSETPPAEIVRVGHEPVTEHLHLKVRLQLQPTPEFYMAEVLYLWEFGGALEALLPASCVGYRLKRVRVHGQMDRFDRGVYEHWPTAFASYRTDPIRMATALLEKGLRVVVTSTDVVSFFDTIDPRFLLTSAFLGRMIAAAAEADREFSAKRFRVATESLLRAFARFRAQRARFGLEGAELQVGVPIGALTSRVIANVALERVDAYVASRASVRLYRRYVDDIVAVSEADPASAPQSRDALLAELFPQFANDDIIVPETGARFKLSPSKTRIHMLTGRPGLEFLRAVEESFSAVVSERRAFLGNVQSLSNEVEAIDLFGENAVGVGHIPRLRDADRFTLRRFMATAYIRGLERCALLLAPEEAQRVIGGRTDRILAALESSWQVEDIEFVLSMLRTAELCSARILALRLASWLERFLAKSLVTRIEKVTWCGATLDTAIALSGLQDYLADRQSELMAGVALLDQQVADSGAKRSALLLYRTGLRYLDREDDVNRGMMDPNTDSSAERLRAVSRLSRWLIRDRAARARLPHVREFLGVSKRLGESVWAGMSAITLFLSARAPNYTDVARRFLARAETGVPREGVGSKIDACVDALRGTRYGLRARPWIEMEKAGGRVVLRLADAVTSPGRVRVVLANLPVGLDAFDAAARGTPMLTLQRLNALDHALREGARAVRLAGERSALLVLPELAVPQRWVRALVGHAVREKLTIVAGLEYSYGADTLRINQAVGIFPDRFSTAAIVRWTKRFPARGEEKRLVAKHGVEFYDPVGTNQRLVVHSPHGRLGVLICSEILEARALAALRGSIELLLVPAWNDDTGSFDHVANSTSSLLVHAFVCIANNAEASDSRIVGPMGAPRHEREWCRLVHRDENQVIWGDLPVEELEKLHREAPAPPTKYEEPKPPRRKFRPLPPGWNSFG